MLLHPNLSSRGVEVKGGDYTVSTRDLLPRTVCKSRLFARIKAFSSGRRWILRSKRRMRCHACKSLKGKRLQTRDPSGGVVVLEYCSRFRDDRKGSNKRALLPSYSSELSYATSLRREAKKCVQIQTIAISG